MKLENLENNEKPREKSYYLGIESLTNTELLAIVLGHGTKDNSVLDFANLIIENVGGLKGIEKKSVQELLLIKGIGKATALKIKAISELSKRIQNENALIKKIHSINDILTLVKSRILSSTNEYLFIILLDRKCNLLSLQEVAKGSVHQVGFDIKELLSIALKNHAHQIRVAHNHPTGDSNPSNNDITFTIEAVKLCSLFNIRVVEHLIITTNSYYSFLENKPEIFKK
jgi:DNA repair protein RadC